MAKKLNALLTRTLNSTKLADRFDALADQYGIKVILANNELTEFHIVCSLTTQQQTAATTILKTRKPNINVTFSSPGELLTKPFMMPIFIND